MTPEIAKAMHEIRQCTACVDNGCDFLLAQARRLAVETVLSMGHIVEYQATLAREGYSIGEIHRRTEIECGGLPVRGRARAGRLRPRQIWMGR